MNEPAQPIKSIKFSVQKKLLLGFGVILILFSLMAVNNLLQIQNIVTIEERLIDVRLPTVMAGMELTDGIHLSLAGLRGYMILGKEPKKAELFKAERQQGWEKIDSALQQMMDFSKNWTVAKNKQLLNEMTSLVDEFRQVQQEVEDISHQPDNIPALKMLLTQAAPQAKKIVAAITSLIDEEALLAATPERKQLLKLLADSRGSFSLALADIRAYLLSGDRQFADDFRDQLKINETRFEQVSEMAYLFNDKQSKAWEAYQHERTLFISLPEKMVALREAKDWNKANDILGNKAAPTAKKIMNILKQMRESQDNLALHDQEELNSATHSIKTIMITGTLVVIILGIFISVFISRIITIPLNRVVKRAKEISAGNLTHSALQISSNDELGELTIAVNDMSHSLLDIVKHITTSSREICDSSSELSAITRRTSKIIYEQQTQTEQASTAMTDMSTSVYNISQNIEKTFLAAKEAKTETSDGHRMVDDAVQAIQQLAGQIESGSDVVHQLEDDSDSIGSVLDVIKGIAEQTNLLALNAAIEAARAGESGRGFAVVADEVRTLAGRTQESAQEISLVIEKLQSGSRQAVETMNKSREEAQLVVEQSNKAGLSLTAISTVVERINAMSSEIAGMAEQQNVTTEEVKSNITAISDMAQKTSSGAQDTAIASESLSELSGHLQSAIKQFKI